MEKKRVCIIGGGVGGLSCAHYLSKFADKFEVYLIEREGILGGDARSAVRKDGRHTEKCWHAFAASYDYLFSVLDEVRDRDGIKLLSHLKPLNNFVYAMNDGLYIEKDNSFITNIPNFLTGFKALYNKPVSLSDKIRVIYYYTKAQIISDKRMEKYDSILWKDYVVNCSKEVKTWILDSTAIYLGMDYSKISVHFMFDLMRRNAEFSKYINPQHNFYSFDAPMNEIFFENWKNYLVEKGVSFYLNKNVESLNLTTNAEGDLYIDSVDIYEIPRCDYYVNSMDAAGLASLYPESKKYIPKLIVEKYRFHLLNCNSKQIQTQVLYYLPYKLEYEKDNSIIIFPESEWFLMIRVEGNLWELKDADLLSCGVGIWDRDGDLIKKPAYRCTREEIARECWHQITKSRHNMKLSKEIPKYWDIWESFKYSPEKSEITTYEPKFSNNINTLMLRPHGRDRVIKNLYHATAYCRTEENIYNMNSACEAGTKTAKLINGEEIAPKKKPSFFLRLLRLLF